MRMVIMVLLSLVVGCSTTARKQVLILVEPKVRFTHQIDKDTKLEVEL